MIFKTHNNKCENSCLVQDQLNRRSPSFRLTMRIGSFWNTTSVRDTRRIYHTASSAKCNIPLWKQLKTELLGLFHLNNHSIIIILLIMTLSHLIFTTWDTCINFTSYTTLRDEERSVCLNPLALELDIYSLAHHLCKMWIFYEPRRVTLGNTRHFVEE